VEVRKPIWTSSSFLLYTGGFTVLASAIGALAYLSTQYGQGALVAWTLLPLAVLLAVALAFHRRGRWIAAGVFAVGAVSLWTAFWGELFSWWGWTPSGETNGPYDGFNWSIWLIALLTLAAALAARRRFRFPLLIIFVIESVYYVVTDIVSNGGSWTVVVTLFFGFAFLVVGLTLDRGPRRPYGFWYHFAAAGQIGGALLYWWHSSETDWALLATAAVIYCFLGALTRRSIWAVYGVVGIVAAATHWTLEWTATPFSSVFAPPRFWVPPLVFGVVGFFIVVLGLLTGRRERTPQSA
jgi:hypothetical protein